MAISSSNIPLYTPAADFRLLDTVSNSMVSLADVRGTKGTLIYFICNHCPYVIHVREELVKVARDYLPQGIGCVAISSNDIVNYPQDAPEKMREVALNLNFPFPYLFDETQEVARTYQAACTPDIFLFDSNDQLFYHGQLDDARPGNGKLVTGFSLRQAIAALLAGQKPPEVQIPSMGCSIKWKA